MPRSTVAAFVRVNAKLPPLIGDGVAVPRCPSPRPTQLLRRHVRAGTCVDAANGVTVPLLVDNRTGRIRAQCSALSL